MKKILILLIAVLTTAPICVQANTNHSNSSCNIAVYQLFPTQNMWTFIKLNTRNGQMWQVQYSMEAATRFQSTLSLTSRVTRDNERNGRFTLVPTQNMWTFILLDQIDGRVWQVQWGTEASSRVVTPIIIKKAITTNKRSVACGTIKL